MTPQYVSDSRVLPQLEVKRLELLDVLYGPVLGVVSDCLRSMLMAGEGKRLIVGDFAQIECRLSAWMCGQDDLCQAFRDNVGVYERMAGHIFGVPSSEIAEGSFERWFGKTTVLGCGYGMGRPKFVDTCAKEGQAVTEEQAEKAVYTFRDINHRIQSGWYELQAAAMAAVRDPGSKHHACRVAYKAKDGFLFCQLPSAGCSSTRAPRSSGTRTLTWAFRRSARCWTSLSSTTYPYSSEAVARRPVGSPNRIWTARTRSS